MPEAIGTVVRAGGGLAMPNRCCRIMLPGDRAGGGSLIVLHVSVGVFAGAVFTHTM